MEGSCILCFEPVNPSAFCKWWHNLEVERILTKTPMIIYIMEVEIDIAQSCRMNTGCYIDMYKNKSNNNTSLINHHLSLVSLFKTAKIYVDMW